MFAIYPHLCHEISEYKVTLRELAAIAKMNRVALCLSLCGIRRWKLTETVNICCFFRNPDAEHLFHKGTVRFHVFTL